MRFFSGARLGLSKVVQTFVFSCCLLLSSFVVPEVAQAATQVQLEGELQVLHWDNRDHTSVIKHFLTTVDGKRYELKFQGRAPHHLLTGAKLRVKGSLSGNTLALTSGSTGTQVVAAAPSYSTGVQKTAVILVNFQDNMAQPITPAAAQNLVFSTVNSYYLENSFQQTSFTGSVFGWFTIPVTAGTTCPALDTIATDANSAATAAGADLTQFTRFVYLFPQASGCTWAGMAIVGGTGTQAFINGNFTLMTVGHELGHNLGMMHAHGLDCGATTIGITCTTTEYGDTTDIMGNNPAHVNAYHKEQLGWLNASGLPPITTVQANGTYTIDPYETNSANPKALKILKSTDPTTGAKTWYYVEYRQPVGFDSVLSTVGNLTSGLVVHIGTDGNINSSDLLDMTPNSSTIEPYDMQDAALAVGASFSDSTAGVTITPSWINGTNAGVTVNFTQTACTHTNPSVVLSTAQTASVNAGTAVTYTLAVTNNDSAGCASSTFNLKSVVPSGWTGSLGNSSLTLSPGSAQSTTLIVTSSTNVMAGNYTISGSATSSTSSSYTSSGSSTYSVATSTSSGTTTTTTKKKH